MCPECGAEVERTYIRTTCTECGASLRDAAPLGAPAPPVLESSPAVSASPPGEFDPAPLPPDPEPTHAAPEPTHGAPEAAGSASPCGHTPTAPTEASATTAIPWADGSAEPAFELAPAPRRVPILLRAQLKLGGVLPMMGWFFIALGSVFVWIFGSMADLSFLTMAGPKATAEATATGNERTNISEGDDDSSTPIYATRYTFRSADGAEHEGVSFAPGRALERGETARVVYLESDPSRSRLEGMRHRPLPAVVLFVFLFPLIGFGFALGGFLAGLRAVPLLRDGQPAYGVLAGMEATNTTINNSPVMKMTFRFTAEDGQEYTATAKTHETGLLTDSRRELLVYDPQNPARAVLFDSLPGRPVIGPDGELVVRSPGGAMLSLTLALAGFASMTGWLWYTLMA